MTRPTWMSREYALLGQENASYPSPSIFYSVFVYIFDLSVLIHRGLPEIPLLGPLGVPKLTEKSLIPLIIYFATVISLLPSI